MSFHELGRPGLIGGLGWIAWIIASSINLLRL